MFSKSLKALTLASAIVVPTATGAVAYPHTPYQLQIERQINTVIAAARALGFSYIVSNQRGYIYRDGRVTFAVHLTAGAEYRFEGRCDTDCTDLDLVLRDASGRELLADRALDDAPGFVVRAPYTGVYHVTLEMARCHTYRCQVGAVVLARA
jgi:hypothetical protein